MKTATSVPSVWPGYVAAIASLVLSLLLLLAILVFALTQVGHLVSAYMQNLMREALQEVPRVESASGVATGTSAGASVGGTASAGGSASPSGNASARLASVAHPEAGRAGGTSAKPASGLAQRQLRLVFAADLADIPPAQLAEVVSLLQQMQTPAEGAWSIWAPVLASDALMGRAAYRLMLSLRQTLIAQGASEKQIGLQLQPRDTPPPGYAEGEIVVYVAPLHLLSRERGQP